MQVIQCPQTAHATRLRKIEKSVREIDRHETLHEAAARSEITHITDKADKGASLH